MAAAVGDQAVAGRSASGVSAGIKVLRLAPLDGASTEEQIAQSSSIKEEILSLADRSPWGPVKGGLVFPPRQDSLSRADTEPNSVIVLYAVDMDSKVVGYLILHLGEAINRKYADRTVRCLERLGTPVPAFIRSVCVDPNVRGKGIGQALLLEALQIAKSKGATAVAGHVKCHPDLDTRLFAAFTRAGFRESEGRVSVNVTRGKDGCFMELESHPWGREQCPDELQFEYIVWVAAVPGFRLEGNCSAVRAISGE